MKFSLVFAVSVVSGDSYKDPCTRLDSTSCCREDGICHGMNNKTCEEAYVEISASRFPILLNIPPIIKRLIPVVHRAAKMIGVEKFAPSPIELPIEISTNSIHGKFQTQLVLLRLSLENQFPYIVSDLSLAIAVLKATGEVVGWMKNNPTFSTTAYKTYWLDSTLLWDILSNLKLSMEYMLTLDRDDPVRRAIFGNILPYFHLQLTIHAMLGFPPPFTGPEYLEFLTTASNYDPHYVVKDWRIWKIDRPTELDRITIPVISDEPGLPLSVLDALGLDPEYTMDVEEAWERVVRGTALMERIGACESFIEYTQSSVLFLMHHVDDAIDGSHAEYCELYGYTWWTAIDQLMQKCPHYLQTFKPIITYMFRLCDHSYFALEDRVGKFFPLLVPPPNNETTTLFTVRYDASDADQVRKFLYEFSCVTQSEISGKLWLIREGQSDQSHQEHIRLLEEFTPHVWTLIPQWTWQLSQISHPPKQNYFVEVRGALVGAGIMTGLLLRERDPHRVLRTALSSWAQPSFDGWSYSVRRGFCRVVNCVGLDLVFGNSETLEMLDILQSITVN